MCALSARLCHPVFIQSVTAHAGSLPAAHSLLHCDAAISGVKKAEDGSGDIIVRIYDNSGNSGDVKLVFAVEIISAKLCNIMEASVKTLEMSGNTVTVPLRANGIATIRVAI